MTKEEFLAKLKEDEEFSPGWQAVEDAFEELYPGQKPAHYGTTIQSRAMFGGNEYLDGFSIYNSENGYKHIVTFGMTILYGDEEAFGGEWNGWGYEMTMKLAEETPEACLWALDMMSNLARYTYTSKRFFEDHQYVGGNGTPIKLNSDSKITALAIVYDTEAKTQTSVYGKTEFLQLVGLTTKEMDAIREDRNNLDIILNNMRNDGNVNLVTDMNRQKEYI